MSYVQEIAAQALLVLDRRGWQQCAPQSDHDPICLAFALSIGASELGLGRWPAQSLVAAVKAAVGDEVAGSDGGIAWMSNWNDAPWRTREDVVLVLKRVAAGE